MIKFTNRSRLEQQQQADLMISVQMRVRIQTMSSFCRFSIHVGTRILLNKYSYWFACSKVNELTARKLVR